VRFADLPQGTEKALASGYERLENPIRETLFGMIDRRSIRRTKVVKDAKILANRCSIPCTVIDLTNTGACISFTRGQNVPDRFELTFGSRQPRRACRVTWRSDNQVGVAFEPTRS
jgi:hypothetical protein